MRIDLVANLRARRYLGEPGLVARVRRAAAHRCTVHVTRELGELDAVCAELARRGTDLVVLSGGDGTLMAGVTALARAFGPGRMPIVAPVPGGTVGTVARNWGVDGDPVDCLRWALDHPSAIGLKRTLRIDAVARPGEPPATRYGFIFGTGLVAQFFELYYERGAPGSAASALIVARVFLESFVGGSFARRVLEPLPCTLRVDGEARPPASWSLVCASVVPNLGIHMLVNYRAGEDPARVHLVASPLPARHLGPRAPFVLAGRRIGGAGHVDELARDFAVEFAERGPYVLDGELLRAERVRVSMGPTVRMVTPS